MVSTAGAVFITIFALIAAGGIGWIVFTQLRARRLGLPPPPLASYLPWVKSDGGYGSSRSHHSDVGIFAWFKDKLGGLRNRNKRTAAGAYEQSGGQQQQQQQRGGFGPLDPDDAWDTRVGNEADSYGYHEERELEGRGRGGPAFGAGSTEYGGAVDYSSRNLGASVARPHSDEEEHRGRAGQPAANPFDDSAAVGMRDVSPRPMGGALAGAPAGSAPMRDSLDGRRSMFREEV